MIGLDTNVIVRHIMQDDKIQSPKATDWIERRLTDDSPGFVSLVTIAETAWVLERRFSLPIGQVALAIERILQIESISVQNEEDVFFAMEVAKSHRGSFADALVSALSIHEGCAFTLTFDRRASRLIGFQLIP